MEIVPPIPCSPIRLARRSASQVGRDGFLATKNRPSTATTLLNPERSLIAGLLWVLAACVVWGGSLADTNACAQEAPAEPGGKAWGRLSVMCQYYCEITPLFEVPPEAFTPPPKVQSMFIKLVPHAHPPVAISDMAVFSRLVTQAFSPLSRYPSS